MIPIDKQIEKFPTVVIYHANCPDGFTAAWVAYKKAHELGLACPMLIPASYGDHIPPVMPRDPAGPRMIGGLHPEDRVLIVDFSYSREVLLDLRGKVEDLIVLDHHKSAEEHLKDLDFCYFNLEMSGATMAWKYFYGEANPPALIAYVEDRDLWRFKLNRSREISQWLRCFPYSLEAWDDAFYTLKSSRGMMDAIQQGEAMLRFQENMVRLMADQAVMVDFQATAAGGVFRVPMANASCFFSEVGEELCKRHPECPFSLYYFDRKDSKRQWGMRSRSGFDCSEVAKACGGGGHPGAAGFTSPVWWTPDRARPGVDTPTTTFMSAKKFDEAYPWFHGEKK